MSSDLILAGAEVRSLMERLISNYHPALDPAEILVFFREKAKKSGGNLVPGSASKVSKHMLAIPETAKYRFMIELPGDLWNSEFNDDERQACLDRQLCSLKAEIQEDSGEIKYSMRKPEHTYYSGELKRWGAWFASYIEGDEDESGSVDQQEHERAAAKLEGQINES